MTERLVREIMIDVFEFPHIPYWFTLRQVAGILKKSMSGGKCLRPLAALVFDEKYNLLGHISAEDITSAIGKALGNSVVSAPDAAAAALQELSDKPASILLQQSKSFADPDDTVSKAADLMFAGNLSLIPVLENQKKLVGIVRSAEIFEYLSSTFMKV